MLELRRKIAILKSSSTASAPLLTSPPPIPSPMPPAPQFCSIAPPPLSTQFPIHVPNLDDYVGKFDGENGVGVELRFQEFDHACNIFPMNEERKFFCVRRLLTDTAALFAKTSGARSYADLKDKLLKTFTKKPSVEEVF